MTTRARIRRLLALTLFLVPLVAGAMPHRAFAHWADQAVAEIVLERQEVRIALTFPTTFAAFADDDGNGRISPAEVESHGPALERFFGTRLTVRGSAGMPAGSARPGRLRVAGADLAEARVLSGGGKVTHSVLLLAYAWSAPVDAVTVRYDLFLPDAPAASCLATINGGGDVRSVVFTPERREASFSLGRVSRLSQTAGFVALGVRHILSGYDHLLFLLSLLLAGGTLRPLVRIVTAFTAAHSVTLSLAALGLVVIPGRWVESAIALSIAYVAAENLWRRDTPMRRRWLVTFGFGLVHGLGFASVLQELAVPRSALLTSLVGFNLGVEMGQVSAVAAATLALRLVRAWPGEAPLRRWISVGTVAAGLLWFVQRAFLGA